MEKEAETGVSWPHTRGPPRARRSRKRQEVASSGTCGGSAALPHLDLRRLVSRTGEMVSVA